MKYNKILKRKLSWINNVVHPGAEALWLGCFEWKLLQAAATHHPL